MYFKIINTFLKKKKKKKTAYASSSKLSKELRNGIKN